VLYEAVTIPGRKEIFSCLQAPSSNLDCIFLLAPSPRPTWKWKMLHFFPFPFERPLHHLLPMSYNHPTARMRRIHGCGPMCLNFTHCEAGIDVYPYQAACRHLYCLRYIHSYLCLLPQPLCTTRLSTEESWHCRLEGSILPFYRPIAAAMAHQGSANPQQDTPMPFATTPTCISQCHAAPGPGQPFRMAGKHWVHRSARPVVLPTASRLPPAPATQLPYTTIIVLHTADASLSPPYQITHAVDVVLGDIARPTGRHDASDTAPGRPLIRYRSLPALASRELCICCVPPWKSNESSMRRHEPAQAEGRAHGAK
jgi:hypothetical protein